jgi:hypothetical protein
MSQDYITTIKMIDIKMNLVQVLCFYLGYIIKVFIELISVLRRCEVKFP